MAYKTIQTKTEGRVGVITLDRPTALNALCDELTRELTAALADFEKDEEIGCVVLTGSAKAFAAGADIRSLVDTGPAEMMARDDEANWAALRHCKTPIVAAVNGSPLLLGIGRNGEYLVGSDVAAVIAHTRDSHRRLIRQHTEAFDGGFVTCGSVMEGVDIFLPEGWRGTDQIITHQAFAALPDGRSVVGLQLAQTREHHVFVAESKALHLNLPNDLFNGFHRTLRTARRRTACRAGRRPNADDRRTDT